MYKHDTIVIRDDDTIFIENYLARLIAQMADEIATEEDAEIFRILESAHNSGNKDI